jgi:polar amino acid transport system substrate-binding protein
MKTSRLMIVLIVSALLISSCAPMGMGGSGTGQGPTLGAILDRGELIVGTSGSMPPMNMTDKNGRIFGLEPDLASGFADSMGVTLRLVPMPFKDLLPALEAGKVDMVLSGMTITPHRNLKVAFVGPYFVSGKGLLTKIETLVAITDPSEINTPSTRLAALEGSTSAQFVKEMLPEAKLLTAPTHDDAVRMVIQNQVDAMIADYQFCAVAVIRNPEAGLLSLAAPLTYEPIGVALPASDPHLVNWVTNFLNTVSASGDLAALKLDWYTNAAWLNELADPEQADPEQADSGNPQD